MGGVGWGHGMKANPTGFLWSKYECFLVSICQDIDFYKTLTRKS